MAVDVTASSFRIERSESVDGPIEVHVEAVPLAYSAYQSYPNPFNPVCTIRYYIASAGSVRLHVFEVNGSVVRTAASPRWTMFEPFAWQ